MVKRCAIDPVGTREASEGLLGSFPDLGLQEEHAREADGFPSPRCNRFVMCYDVL